MTAETGRIGAFSRKRAARERLDVLLRQLEHLLVDQVDLGQRDEPVLDPEQGA